MKQYFVIGGEYKDTSFETLQEGQNLEKMGPFESYEEAEVVWSAKAWETVDSCNSRYEIIEE